MSETYSSRRRGWNKAHKEYTCTDGIIIICKFEIIVRSKYGM